MNLWVWSLLFLNNDIFKLTSTTKKRKDGWKEVPGFLKTLDSHLSCFSDAQKDSLRDASRYLSSILLFHSPNSYGQTRNVGIACFSPLPYVFRPHKNRKMPPATDFESLGNRRQILENCSNNKLTKVQFVFFKTKAFLWMPFSGSSFFKKLTFNITKIIDKKVVWKNNTAFRNCL